MSGRNKSSGRPAQSGNPLHFEPIPDFGPLADDAEEREAAVQMAAGGLEAIVAPGASAKSRHKAGILLASLRYLARHLPAAGLPGYIDLLSSLPPEAGVDVKQEAKLAAEMADSLKVEVAKNPLLRTNGKPLDPALLFGDAPYTAVPPLPGKGRVRISVVSLLGLTTDAAQAAFVNQLAMSLFAWIRKNPEPPDGRPLRGLLVMDEAKDFVPSQRATACKESLQRLAAQARKYRLGLVFATQHPKDVDTKVVGNCATHLYGRSSTPASLDALDDLMKARGGGGGDFGRLTAGQFYAHNADAGHHAPIKIQVPNSLSFSPKSPLDEARIMEKAQKSRRRLDRAS